MAAITEKVNKTSVFLATLCDEPAERYAIACVLMEMYKYEMNKAFVPFEKPKNDA